MIEVYDEHEKQFIMINLSKVNIIYPSMDKKNTLTNVEGLEYPVRAKDSYEEIKSRIMKRGKDSEIY